MHKARRRSVAASAVVLIITLGRLVGTKALATVRTVDALLIFAAGMAAGVLLVQVFAMRRAKSGRS